MYLWPEFEWRCSTFCGKNTNQWVYFTPGCVSHRRVPEWDHWLLTFLKSCEIHHSNKKWSGWSSTYKRKVELFGVSQKRGRRAGVSLASSSLWFSLERAPRKVLCKPADLKDRTYNSTSYMKRDLGSFHSGTWEDRNGLSWFCWTQSDGGFALTLEDRPYLVTLWDCYCSELWN